MADDIATKTAQAATLNKELGNTPDAIADISRENKNYQRIALAASRKRKQALDEEFKSYKRVKSEISAMADLAESSIERFSKAQNKALLSSNSTNMMQLQAIKAQALNIAATTKNLEYLNSKLLDTANSYKDASKSYVTATQKYNETLQNLDKELKTGKINQDQYTESLSKAKVEVNAIKDVMVNLEQEAEGVTKAVLEQRKAFIRHVEALREEKKEAIRVDIEYRKLKGGVEGLSASLEEISRAKISEFAAKFEGVAGVTLGVKMLGEAWTDVAEVYRSTNKLAITMGETNRRSFSNFARSIMDGQRLAGNMQATAARLGYTLEEMNEVVQKVRVGIRFDREGRLAVSAINALSNETALFARVCNIDLGDAVNMASTRIHQYGMSSEEAISDMTQMRSTLLAMSSGIKGANVPLDDMVKLIDEASQSSQSYIVDARLMTQAMRGAANQAVALGASKKQAMEITKGMGEVLSKAPEFISLPVGLDLLDKLTGGDSEAFLSKFDEATRKQLADIKKMHDKGEVNDYYLARRLNELIGSSSEGIETQLDRFNQYIEGDNLDAAITVLMKGYGIKNVDTATNIAKMLKTVKEDRETFKEDMFDVGLLLSGQASSLEAIASSTVKSQEQKVKELEDFGLSTQKAEEYLAKYNTKTDQYIAAEKELAAARAENREPEDNARVLAAEKEMNKQRTRMTLETTELAMQPGKAMLRELRTLETGGEAVEIDAKLSNEQLGKIGVKGWEDLGKKIGVDLEKNEEQLKLMYRDGITASQADKLHAEDMRVAKEAKDAVEAPENNITDVFNRLGYDGPIVRTLIGLGLIIAGPMMVNTLKTAFLTGFAGIKKIPEVYKSMKDLPKTLGNFWAKRSASKSAKVALEKAYGKGSKYIEDDVLQIGKKAGEAASTSAKAASKAADVAKEAYSGGSYIEDVLKVGKQATTTGHLDETVLKDASKKSSGYFSKFSKMLSNIGRKHPKSVGTLGALTAVTAGSMFFSGDSKAAEAEGAAAGTKEKPEESDLKISSPLLASAGVGLGAGGIKAAKAIKAARAAKFSTISAKVTAKTAAKGGARLIPGIGNVISVGFATMAAWDLYKKWQKDPKSITPGDQARMVAELASIIPGIGNAVMLANMTMDLTGGYDVLDDKYKKETTTVLKGLTSVATLGLGGPDAGGALYDYAMNKAGIQTSFDDKQIAGMRIPAPPEDAQARTGGRTTGGSARIAQGRAQANPLSIKPNGDFEVKLTIENFSSAITGHRKQIANSVSGVG